MMKKLVFATNNAHKLYEVKALLGNSYELLSPQDIGCIEEIPENQPDLEGNALEKARFISAKYNIDCFADDTGLVVDSLCGAPGVFSARYAGPEKDPARNMAKLLKELNGKTNRKARFITVIALVMNNKEFTFTGAVEGEILIEPRGNKGFGYDPVFLPDGYKQSFAEMDLTEKNKISHRARAVNKFIEFLHSL